jgi:hypothetical protein
MAALDELSKSDKLEKWLMQASRCLSQKSRSTVRDEILDHYEASRDEALGNGATWQEAEVMALRALGDPGEANRLYRRSLLTSAEARILGEGNWEARAVCSFPIIKSLMLALPVVVFLAGVFALLARKNELAFSLLPVSLLCSVLLHGPFLPIYTPLRSRIYRGLKWTALAGVFLAIVGWLGWRDSWVCMGGLWICVWTEWTRFSIRRKLPIDRWPKQLHL